MYNPRITVRIVLIFVFVSAATAYFLPAVSSQRKDDETAPKPDDAAVTIQAKDRGNPNVSFENGRAISVPAGVSQGAPLKVIGSGDVDSDGVPDLVAVDAGGSIVVYRGNPDTIFPNSPEAQQRSAEGTFSNDPFQLSHRSTAFPVIPDEIAVGDLSADGILDIVAIKYGDNRMYISFGGGNGMFSDPVAYPIGQAVTAFAAGEIGRSDGQMDLAIAFSNKNGHFISVFANPGGAFDKSPELIKIAHPARSLAIGNLDADFYGDIAAASGNNVTLIRGRGRVAPWDGIEGIMLERPAPIVESRTMPFDIADLATGHFTVQRGQSLAMLTTAGTIETLTSTKPDLGRKRFSQYQLGQRAVSPLKGSQSQRFADYRKYVEPTAAVTDEVALLDMDEAFPAGTTDIEKYQAERREKRANAYAALSPEERSAKEAREAIEAADAKERSKAGFLRAISPAKMEHLSRWKTATVASDARIARSTATGFRSKLVKVRVSDSDLDEIALVDATSSQIHLIVRENSKRSLAPAARDIVAFDVQGSPTAILPMRLNPDALSDLIVLTEGATTPSYLMTAPSATFVVTSISDADTGSCGANCTLREAINAANDTNGVDTITFNIGGGGARLIQPATSLPTVDFAVTIDATTQPGYIGTPLIEIKGNLAEVGSNGLNINAANCNVRGFAINEFRQDQDDPKETGVGGFGISIFNFEFQTNANNNIIERNFLGTDLFGFLDRGNQGGGLQIFDSDLNIVGGTASFQRNVMSGNGNGEIANGQHFGAGMIVTAGDSNFIVGNYFGLAVDGSTAVGNSAGLRVSGSDNLIGHDTVGAANVASGNRHLYTPSESWPGWCDGIGISDESLANVTSGEWETAFNNYRGNRVGTNASGTAAVSNCSTGLFTSPRNSASVGSVTNIGRNIVSGNRNGGLMCSIFPPFGFSQFRSPSGGGSNDGIQAPEGFCSITGNNVGMDITGNVAIPNNHDSIEVPTVGGILFISVFGGIGVYNTDTFSSVGGVSGTSAGSCTGFCNLVSGNLGANPNAFFNGNMPGINRAGRNGEVGIFKNYIGTNSAGTAARPNGNGVWLWIAGSTRIGDVLFQGQTQSSLGNLISGNVDNTGFAGNAVNDGVDSGSLVLYIIRGNLMGTDRTGVSAVPNARGLRLLGRQGAGVIGGIEPAARNVISGNSGTGITLFDVPSAPTVNNYIGVNINGDPLGNGGNGIELTGNFDFIGDNGIGNVIANNGQSGILVRWLGSGGYPQGNRIRFNSIYNNGGLGIDLSAATTPPYAADGVTPNDCGDPDTGPNGLQNYPVLTAPVFNVDGTVTVGGAFDSEPSKTYTFDFYSNTIADPTNYGEGETYIGSSTATTGANGRTSLQFTSTVPVAAGLKITATATDPNGNTSEFSCVAGDCSFTGGRYGESSLEEFAGGGCTIGFVVNIDTDEADPNPSDGICDVDPNTPGEQCSLRAAIQTANAIEGADFINFNIPGGGIKEILPTSDLPPITDQVFINATTQPGYTDRPLIALIKIPGLTISAGLVFEQGSDGSSLSGLTINRFPTGIKLKSDENTIDRSIFGLDSDGTTIPNEGQRSNYGIDIEGDNNTIGSIRKGENDENRNYFTGHAFAGIRISGSNNKVIGSSFGFLRDGESSKDLFSFYNIKILGGDSNTIGGDTLGEGNVMVNATDCINITDGANSNVISSNVISTCTYGVFIANSHENTIGGTISEGRRNFFVENVIAVLIGDLPDPAANLYRVKRSVDTTPITKRPRRTTDVTGGEPARDNSVFGNVFGIASNLTFSDNDYGVVVARAINTQIGSGTFGQHNFISNSLVAGVVLTKDSINTKVRANFIGTDISGQNIAANEIGVLVHASNNEVSNNVISGNNLDGVRVVDEFLGDPIPTRNLISSNYIGTNAAGTVAIPNGGNGVSVFGNENSITQNIVSNNEFVGITVKGESNVAANNTVGTNGAGTVAMPNIQGGVGVIGSGNFVRQNLISGNRYGILLRNDPAGKLVTDANRIEGNTIGANRDLTAPIPNEENGIVLSTAFSNRIFNNTVVGNIVHGVVIQTGSNNNILRGNYIGTTPAGLSMPNGGAGIRITNNSTGNEIGGNTLPTPPITNNQYLGLGEITIKNVIAKNGGDGIVIEGSSGNAIGGVGVGNEIFANVGNGISIIGTTSANNVVSGNLIGTTAAAPLLGRKRMRGSTLGNGGHGILIVDAPNTQIGQAGAGGGNKIFDSTLDGIRVTSMTGTFPLGAQLFVSGNDVSFNLGSGIVNAVVHDVLHVIQNNIVEANEDVGINLADSDNNSVTQNIVANNGEEGVVLVGPSTRLNNVRGNTIADNVSHGVNIDNGANTNNVGGPDSGQGNTIRNNGGAGINLTPTAGNGNNLDPNSIFGNVGLGIDLGGDGFTLNDPGDADVGPNKLQNYPDIFSKQVVNDELIVTYRVDSAPEHSAYGTSGIYVEFFKADAAGQGETFIGSTFYTLTDYNTGMPGIKTVNLGNIVTLGYTPGDPITGTATDAEGNTSEFTPQLIPSSAGVEISGRVTTPTGAPIRGAVVTMTDTSGTRRSVATSGFGYFQFENVEAGMTYVVDVKARRYSFTPRLVSVLDKMTDIDFVAIE